MKMTHGASSRVRLPCWWGRSNPDLKMPLQFERIEPYVIPKTSLTGQGTERPDMRVLQVIYSFDRGVLPVYIGQQVDAYIETSTSGAPSTFSTAPSQKAK